MVKSCRHPGPSIMTLLEVNKRLVSPPIFSTVAWTYWAFFWAMIIKAWSSAKPPQHRLRTCSKSKVSGPIPDLLNHKCWGWPSNIPLNKSSRWFWFTVKLGSHCVRRQGENTIYNCPASCIHVICKIWNKPWFSFSSFSELSLRRSSSWDDVNLLVVNLKITNLSAVLY